MRCWGNWLRNDVSGPFTGDAPGETGTNLIPVDLGTGLVPLQLVAGEGATCVLFTNQRVKCWGSATAFGTLGYGDSTARNPLDASKMGDNLPFVDLGTNVRVRQIAMKNLHVCVVTTDDRVKCWGDNSFGQLGLGDTNHRGTSASQMGDNLPYVELGVQFTVEEIVCGAHHTCALLDTGDIKCFGNNDQGQLGYQDTEHRGDGPNEMGNNLPIVQLGTGVTALQVDAAGSVLCGDVNGTITCFAQHTCAVVTGFQVKCWGDNENGQLGLEDTTLRGDLPNTMGDNLPTVDLGFGEEVDEVSIDASLSCARSRLQGTVKCWGFNFRGALGQGDTTKRGDLPGTMGANLPPIDLGTAAQPVAIVETGIFFTCVAFETNYNVKCFGNNLQGNLGLGDTNHRGDVAGEMGDSLPFVDLGSGRSMFDGTTAAPTQSPTLFPTVPTSFPTQSPTTPAPTPLPTTEPTSSPVPTLEPTTAAPTPTPDRTELYLGLIGGGVALVAVACVCCAYFNRMSDGVEPLQ